MNRLCGDCGEYQDCCKLLAPRTAPREAAIRLAVLNWTTVSVQSGYSTRRTCRWQMCVPSLSGQKPQKDLDDIVVRIVSGSTRPFRWGGLASV
eukprot:649494-Amphidinium_carterae.1